MTHRFISKFVAAALPLGVLMLSLSPIARADDPPPPPPPEGVWLGKGQGGLLISSGNTVSDSINAKIDLARIDGPWKNIVYVGGLYGRSTDILNAERLEGRYELDHTITGDLFWFGALNGSKDLFSGFNYQLSASTGLGLKVINTEATKLDVQLGVGYQRLETQELTKNALGEVIARVNGSPEGSIIGTAGANFEHAFSKSTKITDKLLITAGSLNTNVANDLALQVNMNDRLALSIGYGIRDNTKPAAGVKKLDQVETVNLVYSIK
jgi:putative salt-induced outer membrane protein